MKEYITEGIVLGVEPINDYDQLVDLYTKDFGRLKAKVVSGRKILSKLSPHLDPLNFVILRLIQKNNFTVADAITADRLPLIRSSVAKMTAALWLLRVIRQVLFAAAPDRRLWFWLRRSLQTGRISYRQFLKLSGFDPELARCESCESSNVACFVFKDQSFLCERCRSQFSINEVIWF
ncbi:MAG: DNA repair protein RecO [bacterium]|nr:DNA repair protein RecO [bacterium]